MAVLKCVFFGDDFSCAMVFSVFHCVDWAVLQYQMVNYWNLVS